MPAVYQCHEQHKEAATIGEAYMFSVLAHMPFPSSRQHVLVTVVCGDSGSDTDTQTQLLPYPTVKNDQQRRNHCAVAYHELLEGDGKVRHDEREGELCPRLEAQRDTQLLLEVSFNSWDGPAAMP